MKKERKLLNLFLIPVLLIVLIQGTFSFLMLIFSGIRTTMENSIIETDNHLVENRQMVLENEMNEKWRSIYKESDRLSQSLGNVLKKEKSTTEDFLKSEKLQQEYIRAVFPDMLDVLQYNTTSGLFLILANDHTIDDPDSYSGFFIRDSDPTTRIDSMTDLLLERGDKQLSQSYSISLDSTWATSFSFAGDGKREADNFFYKPYLAAKAHSNVSMEDLGYWAKPFILENQSIDSHSMITYSVPLIHDHVIYGVVGVEISISYLDSYFPVRDFDSGLNAGYALAIEGEDTSFYGIAGTGSLYDTVIRENKTLSFIPQTADFYEVENGKIGNQKIYAMIKPLSLYKSNVPYDDTDWVLCGLVPEDSVYGTGESLYRKMTLMILLSALFAIILVYTLVRRITRPVFQLMDSIRGGIQGIHEFKGSPIAEINELHRVIENLTDSQKQSEEQLLEEKERYLIAVKSSQDVFFTYRQADHTLEIVNSSIADGIWDCEEHPEFFDSDRIHYEDREPFFHAIYSASQDIHIDFRLRTSKGQNYTWYELSGIIMPDSDGITNRIVGCLHNIQKRKELEETQKNKLIYDPITNFYRYQSGCTRIADAMKLTDGSLVLMDICHFTLISEQYGLVFSNILLERMAALLQPKIQALSFGNAVYVRAGADKFMLWIPHTGARTICKEMEQLRRAFSAITDENNLDLEFDCGIAYVTKETSFDEALSQAEQALASALQKSPAIRIYEELNEEDKPVSKEIHLYESIPYERQMRMNLSSLALNLFDKNGNTSVVLDMLAWKISESYPMSNLVITHFNREYLASSLLYQWKALQNPDLAKNLAHCSELDYQNFIKDHPMQELCPFEQLARLRPDIQSQITGHPGLIFHMTDHAVYSGSILFYGVDPDCINREADRKCLQEISTIIQNKINLQQHDLSAQAKSEFLARMSHEIRTPMNGIIGMTEIALQEGQTEERRIDCLQKIESSSNYLLGLLNDILDMSKIESGKMKLASDICNLREVLLNLESVLGTKLEEQSIHLRRNISLQNTFFICDQVRLNQVLVNLLSNAVKYSSAGSSVFLTAEETPVDENTSEIYFAVKDEGAGIAKEKQEIIFQSFEQADNTTLERSQGTGLGLAISSRIIHMMDSEIQVTSAPGEGSTFSFTLQLNVHHKEEETPDSRSTSLALHGKRVLVAEDNELNMEIAHTLLKSFDIEVEEAYNGEQAVQLMLQSEPGYYDLILMDIMMPVMNGYEATRKIRRSGRTDCQTIPIVAMSANAFEEDVKQSIACGMNRHMAKPVTIKKLQQMLEEEL